MTATKSHHHPKGGTFTYSLGEAIADGVCVPATFDRFNGEFEVKIGTHPIRVSGTKPTNIPDAIKKIANPAVQKSLDYETLAYTPIFDKYGEPDVNSYHGSMVRQASIKLDETRHDLPTAGGLVIARSIEMAEYFQKLFEKIEGEKPMIVHSNKPNASKIIRRFRNSKKRWIVSVAMISEGVDIKRLRVLVYLPNAKTELAFRQSIGRVIRSMGKNDISRAYIIMPILKTFDDFARRIEDEMPSIKPTIPTGPITKKCGVCLMESPLSAVECPGCGAEFPKPKVTNIACHHCESLNPKNATTCSSCGTSMTPTFIIDHKSAWRESVICRGMEISDSDAEAGVKLNDAMKHDVLYSGNPTVIKIFQQIPAEAMETIASIFNKHAGKPS